MPGGLGVIEGPLCDAQVDAGRQNGQAHRPLQLVLRVGHQQRRGRIES
jgi:hypothetical protein